QVTANAGQLGKGTRFVRHNPAVLALDPPRGAVKVSGTAVVAESLPKAEHLLFIGSRQVAQGWKGANKALEIRYDGGNLGLLKHEFADPDPIGISICPPGELALMRRGPIQ